MSVLVKAHNCGAHIIHPSIHSPTHPTYTSTHPSTHPPTHPPSHPLQVITLDGKAVWRRRHYRVRRAELPGTFHFSVLDNGVISKEFWRIVHVTEDLSWGLFYYAGAASVVGQAYRGQSTYIQLTVSVSGFAHILLELLLLGFNVGDIFKHLFDQ